MIKLKHTVSTKRIWHSTDSAADSIVRAYFVNKPVEASFIIHFFNQLCPHILISGQAAPHGRPYER